MTLRWSTVASSDLEDIYNYIATDSADVAAATVERLIKAAEQLVDFPQLGRLGRITGTREFVIAPYILVYRVQGFDLVNIEAVIHGARRT